MTDVQRAQPGALEKASRAIAVFRRAGFLSPRFLYSTARAAVRHGPSTAMGPAAAAQYRPSDVAVIDEAGSISFLGLHRRMLSIAHGLSDLGVGEGTQVGILCRNHRGFIESVGALGLLGAHACFLNTGFAGPQLADVARREGLGCILYDDEFEDVVAAGAGDAIRIRVWCESGARGGAARLDDLATSYPAEPLTKPGAPGRATILTSGTTGTPKGAQRSSSTTDLDTVVGLLEALPIRVGDRTLIAAPLFHAWGLAQLLMGSVMGMTMILQRRFEPRAVLEAIERHRAEVLVVVPVMLQRILALDGDTIGKYDTSSLRVTLSSGSALPGELALRWMDTFGDNLHNFYGSTEVAQAAIAGPRDLRDAPGTAGRVPLGTMVRILDGEGREVPVGQTGRIFVGNAAQFEGYTGGGNKEMIDGLMSVGDLGHFDEQGRLFVEGRDDDMIVSGGENVFPAEVEDLLSDHPDILEAAVIGVPDDAFGQRLRAFVVTRPGASVTADAIKDHVKQQLARHKVPRDVIFLDEIPRNPTGKVLKRVLREHPGPEAD